MSRVLRDLHGPLLVVRPPVPATVNKAGVNYKSEVRHLEYSPRGAYDEWLAICEGILAFGGDAVFDFEPEDEPFLDAGDLRLERDGSIRAEDGRVVGHMDEVSTGRVFTANGPWVILEDGGIRALLPNLVAHRRGELAYYRRLLDRIAEEGGYRLHVEQNPHPWEGMADVAAVGDRVVLTYTVRGHYDQHTSPKTMRSTREGVSYAADFAGIPEEARIYAELVYPHFHGDTVHFGARPADGSAPRLVHYAGGLWGDYHGRVREALGGDAIVPIDRHDAVEEYAGNSRQVEGGVLVPAGASEAFTSSLESLGLGIRRIALFELFGKAGGGPACATLYLPRGLRLPEDSPLRYSVRREEARKRRERLPERLVVDPGYFEGKPRG
jgi:hypothetical protein